MTRTSILRASVAMALVLAGGAYAAEMTMYSGTDFRGPDMTVRGAVSNLERIGFNDRAESIIVRSGRWEVCSDADYTGYCTVLGPGDYRALDGPLFRRISSAREVAPYAYNERRYERYGYAAPYATPSEELGRYSALEIYTLPGFRGSTMKFDRDATTLDRSKTEEGVSSLIVREGVWELCTGLDHDGSCRVYEPGRYPRLGSFEGAAVGSLRRVG